MQPIEDIDSKITKCAMQLHRLGLGDGRRSAATRFKDLKLIVLDLTVLCLTPRGQIASSAQTEAGISIAYYSSGRCINDHGVWASQYSHGQISGDLLVGIIPIAIIIEIDPGIQQTVGHGNINADFGGHALLERRDSRQYAVFVSQIGDKTFSTSEVSI